MTKVAKFSPGENFQLHETCIDVGMFLEIAVCNFDELCSLPTPCFRLSDPVSSPLHSDMSLKSSAGGRSVSVSSLTSPTPAPGASLANSTTCFDVSSPSVSNPVRTSSSKEIALISSKFRDKVTLRMMHVVVNAN